MVYCAFPPLLSALFANWYVRQVKSTCESEMSGALGRSTERTVIYAGITAKGT